LAPEMFRAVLEKKTISSPSWDSNPPTVHSLVNCPDNQSMH